MQALLARIKAHHRRPADDPSFRTSRPAAGGKCQRGEAEEPAYEVDATDEGGGELIVAEDQADAVEVDTPDTPMTNVPEESADTVDSGAE